MTHADHTTSRGEGGHEMSYNGLKFSGAQFNRTQGWHKPAPLPPHIMRIILQPRAPKDHQPSPEDAPAGRGIK